MLLLIVLTLAVLNTLRTVFINTRHIPPATTSDTAAVNVCLTMASINLSKVTICCKTEVNTAGY